MLADYWLAALPASEEEAVEEHLLGCDQCGARLREVIALTEGVRNLAREGSLRMVVNDTFLKRAAEEGLRSANTHLRREAASTARLQPRTMCSSRRLAADLEGAERVDL